MELIPSGQMPFMWTLKDPGFKGRWSIYWKMETIRNINAALSRLTHRRLDFLYTEK